MSERPEEVAAAGIVERVTDCQASLQDTGTTGDQLVDYRLFDSSGRQIGVLEITTATDPGWMTFYSRKQGSNRSFCDQRLSNSWFVVMGYPKFPRKFKSKLTRELQKLESTGHTSVSFRHDFVGVNAEPLPAALESLGVVEASAMGSATGGFVVVSLEPRGSAIGIETVTRTVELLASKEDNLTKILSGPGSRAELFVWFNPPHPGLGALVMNSEPPFSETVDSARPPALPDGVTAVWAGAFMNEPEPQASFLWHSDGGAWEIIDAERHQPKVS